MLARIAAQNDIGSMKAVWRDAAPEDPLFVYLWKRRGMGGDTEKYMEETLSHYVNDPYFTVLVVVDESHVVSFGVGAYREPGNRQREKGPDLQYLESMLAKDSRHKALNDTMAEIHQCFHDLHGQFYELIFLYTSPLNRRKGAATMVVNWFMKLAQGRGVPVIVPASPAGERLYSHLEFSCVSNRRVFVPDEQGVEFPVMKWCPRPETSS